MLYVITPSKGIFISTVSISFQCTPNGAVRLVNGTTLQEGRLELCIGSNWSTVCNDHWGESDSRVVCRQLGYNENGK